ncbi:hypothetical protein OEA41_002060 [Lepraria neglecta]|uniref:Uncharacterized protein n=1 Tax=Lepraria neglecta TaxID=209136 RepID=A0AAD9ZAS3_9LECA|nr:hypothetical protein OEA41_002060 [Lepraria neglecta]
MDLWDLSNAKNGDVGADSASNASSETLRFRDIQRRQSAADASQTLEEPFEYIRHFASTGTGFFHASQGHKANHVQVDASKNEDTTAEDVPRVWASLTSNSDMQAQRNKAKVQAPPPFEYPPDLGYQEVPPSQVEELFRRTRGEVLPADHMEHERGQSDIHDRPPIREQHTHSKRTMCKGHQEVNSNHNRGYNRKRRGADPPEVPGYEEWREQEVQ